jgi:hypothetical protein
LDHVHWLGFNSWRWLLILEGAPAIVLGGLAGPTAVGFFAQRFGKITAGLAFVALPLLLAAVLVLLLPKKAGAPAKS